MSAKILIVDDHEIVRQGIHTILHRARPDWEICGESTNGREAIAAVVAQKPDVVVLDISMPVMNGLEAASQISRLGLGTRVLVFTMHESRRLIDEVRATGAHGYVMKSHATRDLIFAIDRVLAGGTFFGPPVDSEAEKGEAPNSGPLLCRALSFA